MVMPRDQNAGQSHIIKNENNFFERMERFKYLEKTLKNKNSVQEEIKSKLKSGNACCHSVQSLLSSSLLSKILKIKIKRIINLPAVLDGCENLLLTLRDKRRLRVLENRVLGIIFGPKRDEVTGMERTK